VPEYLKILHGSYNAVIVILFFYQGWLGLSIRRAASSTSGCQLLPTEPSGEYL
jgi:hypothetical protein